MDQGSTPWTNRSDHPSTHNLPTPEQSLGSAQSLTTETATAISATPPQDTHETWAQNRGRPRIGVLIGIGVAIVLLVMACSVLLPSKPMVSSTAPSRPTTTTAAAQAAGRGLTAGRVTANDGRTLQLQGIRGSSTTVHTTPNTRVIVLLGAKVSDVMVGAMIFVVGNKGADGSIIATLVLGT